MWKYWKLDGTGLSLFSTHFRASVTIWIDVVIKQAASDSKTRTAALERVKETFQPRET